MELNTLSLSDFIKAARVFFDKGVRAANPVMMNSGMVKVEDIPQNTGNTREYTSIDSNRYLSRKPQGEQAARGKVQQGLAIVLVKSLLIVFKTLLEGKKGQAIVRCAA